MTTKYFKYNITTTDVPEDNWKVFERPVFARNPYVKGGKYEHREVLKKIRDCAEFLGQANLAQNNIEYLIDAHGVFTSLSKEMNSAQTLFISS